MRFRIKKGVEEDATPPAVSHKKLAIISVCIVTLAGVGFLIIRNVSNGSASSYQGSVAIKKDACKLFSLRDAKKLLGSSAKDSANNANAVSSKATVSTCSYSSGSDKPEDLIALTILVRTSNRIQARQAFEVAHSAKAEDIKGFGDQAYYNSETSQLNILKNDTWIIIAYTKGTSGKGEANLPKQVAEVILARL